MVRRLLEILELYSGIPRGERERLMKPVFGAENREIDKKEASNSSGVLDLYVF